MACSSMENVQFILEGCCQGAYPVDGIEELLGEQWHADLVSHIKNNEFESAIKVAKEHFSAEFNPENITALEENGFRFVKTLSVNLNLPYVENECDNDIALFKWIGGTFLMEGPREIAENWLIILDNGDKAFDQARFDEWLGGEDSLQDGCCYRLGPAWYDLEGFGENSCNVDQDSLMAGLGIEITTAGLIPGAQSSDFDIALLGPPINDMAIANWPSPRKPLFKLSLSLNEYESSLKQDKVLIGRIYTQDAREAAGLEPLVGGQSLYFYTLDSGDILIVVAEAAVNSSLDKTRSLEVSYIENRGIKLDYTNYSALLGIRDQASLTCYKEAFLLSF